MRAPAGRLAAAACLALAVAAPLRAAEAPSGAGGGPPTIEEMLAAIEEAPAESAPPARDTPAASRRTTSPVPALRTPPDVKAEIKAVKARANRVSALYRKQRNLYKLARLSWNFGNQKQTLLLVAEMIDKKFADASRSPVPRAYALADRYDLYYFDAYRNYSAPREMMYARTLAALGAEREAAKALAEATAKQQRHAGSVPSVHRRELTRTSEFVEGYPAAAARLKEVEAALAEAPTAELQWELVSLCSPPENRAVKPLKWLEALLVMIGRYPDHKAVTSGLAHWQLVHAYRTFAMHEKSAKVLDTLAEWPEKVAISASPWRAGMDDVFWEKANSWAKLGVLQEELKDRGAIASYRKSLEEFEAFRKRFPKDSRCIPGESGVSTLQKRVGGLHEAVVRLTK